MLNYHKPEVAAGVRVDMLVPVIYYIPSRKHREQSSFCVHKRQLINWVSKVVKKNFTGTKKNPAKMKAHPSHQVMYVFTSDLAIIGCASCGLY
jgi:hypothetical protein